MNDSAYSKPRETAGETAPTSTDPWFLANVPLVGFAVYPLIVFAASGWNAWKEGPAQPDPLQIAVLVVTGLVATIFAMALLKPKSNAEGNSMRPGFWQFLYGFFVIGLCGVFNAIFGIFTGRGPQVFFGLGFCYFLHFALLVPVYFKMRPLYRAAQP
jgi:hypothetical protein